jgi:WD40 repeat protein
LQFSPDGSKLASASWDKKVILWNTSTGEQQHTLEGHSAEVIAVQFSPDGSKLASASNDKKVIVWDASIGAQQHTLEGHSEWVTTLQFSPDGSKLASASADKKVIVWDASTGAQKHTLEGHSSRVTAIQFSPDSSKLASASWDEKVIVWDASTGAQKHTLEGHSSRVTAIQFSPDSSKLASASWDEKVIVWDASTGAQQHTIDAKTFVTALEFSADGFFLQTNVGKFELQAAPSGPSGNDAWTSRPQIQGHLWHHRQTMWPPAGQLFLGCAVAAKGSKIAFDHSSIHVTEDDNHHGIDEIGTPIDASTNVTPLLSGTSEEDTRTSSLQLQGDWIHQQDHRMIWLPPELRPFRDVTAVRGEVMAFGHSTGNISIWETSNRLET